MKLSIHHSKPTFCKKDAGMFTAIFASSYIASGRVVIDFERRFAKYIGHRGAVATNSGTSALHLGILALGIKKGDEVIIPSYVCVSLLDAINYVSAKPVLADIDYDTFNISVQDAKRKITRKTKAIIIPHMFGLPCDIDEFLKLGVPIIEDCAQSLGAKYKDKLTGSFGAISIFSFYATKLITTGYGGMIVSKSKKLLGKIQDLNAPDKRENYKVRYNYRMSDLEAALGINQLENLQYFIKKRRQIAMTYTQALSKCEVVLPFHRNHIFYRYVIKTSKADFIRQHLEKNGIEVVPPVYKPLHRYLDTAQKDFPNTERVYREAISLPIYPGLKKREILRVVRVLGDSFHDR